MGDVNASDRIINIFSNNVIVYKQSSSPGRAHGGDSTTRSAEGLIYLVGCFFFKSATFMLKTNKRLLKRAPVPRESAAGQPAGRALGVGKRPVLPRTAPGQRGTQPTSALASQTRGPMHAQLGRATVTPGFGLAARPDTGSPAGRLKLPASTGSGRGEEMACRLLEPGGVETSQGRASESGVST